MQDPKSARKHGNIWSIDGNQSGIRIAPVKPAWNARGHRGESVHLSVCIHIIIFNTKSIIFNAEFIDLMQIATIL